MQEKLWDVAVVGGGLSGLSAALHLQKKRNLKVLLLEKRGHWGGLCGSATVDGFEFPIGCNDFPNQMVGLIRKLGVAVAFKPSRTVFVREGRRFQFPPNSETLKLLLRNLPDLWRFWRGTRKNQIPSLAEAGRRLVRDDTLRDLLSLLAYGHGIAADDLAVEWLRQEKEMGYQHHKMWVPVGGPQALSAALIETFNRRGSSFLNTECQGVDILPGEGQIKLLRSNRGIFLARQVVAATPPPGAPKAALKSGLAAHMLLLAVRKDLTFPEKIHAFAHYPPQTYDWLQQLDRGSLPLEFGFHFFKTTYPANREYDVINFLTWAARGRENPDAAERRQLEGYLLGRAEAILPGLGSAILHKKFLPASEYEERFGLSSRAIHGVTPDGYRKPENYEPTLGIYRAGTDVYPPGDHAGAAFLSGKVAADLMLSRETFT